MELLLPVAFEYDQLTCFETYSESKGQNIRKYLELSFPTLMAHIFPYIAAEQPAVREQLGLRKIQGAKLRYKQLEQLFGRDNFFRLITKHIGDITLGVAKLIHEPLTGVDFELIVTPNPPYFSMAVIKNALLYIGALFEASEKCVLGCDLLDCTLATVLKSTRADLHKVLFGVFENLAKSSTPHGARRALYSIAAVVEVLLEPSAGDLGDAAYYAVHFMSHTLTYYTSLLCEMAPYLSDYCNEILWKVCHYAFERYPMTLVPVIPKVVSRLLPFAKNSSSILKSTLRVLELVIKTTHDELRSVVVRLPPLPDDEDYTDLGHLRIVQSQLASENHSLYEKVENFLTQNYIDSHFLGYLWKEIKISRRALKEIFSKRGVDDESLGHQLMHRLVGFASSSDEKIAIEATKCLGELGPVSLETPVFFIKEENSSQVQYVNNHDIKEIAEIIVILSRYLMSEDIKVVEATSSALFKILSTQEGVAALLELEDCVCKKLFPFRHRDKPKISAFKCSDIDAETYKALIENPDVWFCQTSYAAWVTELTCLLISAGCGNEVLQFILPVCRCKPEFCVFVLPFVFHTSLKYDKINRREILSEQVSLFFQRHIALASDPKPQGR
ncbi:hypothetical protein SK128_022234, partial [Halocaridina rubra]